MLGAVKFTLERRNPIKDAVINTLGAKRIEELIPDKYIMVKVIVNSEGKVIAVQFATTINTQLTPAEVDLLDKAIRRDVTVILP